MVVCSSVEELVDEMGKHPCLSAASSSDECFPLLSADDPLRMIIGYRCIRCGEEFKISLVNLKITMKPKYKRFFLKVEDRNNIVFAFGPILRVKAKKLIHNVE